MFLACMFLVCVCVYVWVCVKVCVCVCVCVLDVYYKAQAQRISNREFKLWTFLQGTKSRVATFLMPAIQIIVIIAFLNVIYDKWNRASLECDSINLT